MSFRFELLVRTGQTDGQET